MNEENLTPRVSNIEPLIEYMAQTQREVTANQELLSQILQKQGEEIQLLRQIAQRHDVHLQRYDETIIVMQGQIGVLLERLLGNL
jgi:type II secretory pathway component PulM